MRRKNSLFITIIITIISITLLLPLEVSAAKICTLSGCDSTCTSSSSYCRLHTCQKDGCHKLRNNNGTIYCNTHAQQYVNSQGYSPCSASGCYRRPTGESSYCSEHKCDKSGCNSKAASGSEYCSNHKPKPVTKKTTTYTKTTNKRTNQKSYKYDAYDDAYDYWEDEYDEDYGEDW